MRQSAITSEQVTAEVQKVFLLSASYSRFGWRVSSSEVRQATRIGLCLQVSAPASRYMTNRGLTQGSVTDNGLEIVCRFCTGLLGAAQTILSTDTPLPLAVGVFKVGLGSRPRSL